MVMTLTIPLDTVAGNYGGDDANALYACKCAVSNKHKSHLLLRLRITILTRMTLLIVISK